MNNNYELPKLVDEQTNNINNTQETVSSPITEEKKYENSLKGMFRYLTTQDTKDLFMLLLRLVIIALIIVVFHLPVSLIKELGVNILTILNITLSDFILNTWYIVCEGLYFIIAMYLFFKIIKTRYYNLVIKKG